MKTEIIYHNPDNLETAGDPPWRFCLKSEKAMPGDEWRQGEIWRPFHRECDMLAHITYRTRRPLPAPQPGGEGEAEEATNFKGGDEPCAHQNQTALVVGVSTPTVHATQSRAINAEESTSNPSLHPQEAFVPVTNYPGVSLGVVTFDLQTGEVIDAVPACHSEPPPIALPVRAEAREDCDPMEGMIEHWHEENKAQTLPVRVGAEWAKETMSIINKLTPQIEGKAFDPDWFLLRQRLEQMDQNATALSRELEEARARQEKFTKALSHDFAEADKVLGRFAGHMSAYTDEITSLRAELEEAKAEVTGLRNRLRERMRQHSALRMAICEATGQEYITDGTAIAGVRAALTALRAAPRSETEGRDKEALRLAKIALDYLRPVRQQMLSTTNSTRAFDAAYAAVAVASAPTLPPTPK